jgi:hypothetical protein
LDLPQSLGIEHSVGSGGEDEEIGATGVLSGVQGILIGVQLSKRYRLHSNAELHEVDVWWGTQDPDEGLCVFGGGGGGGAQHC